MSPRIAYTDVGYTGDSRERMEVKALMRYGHREDIGATIARLREQQGWSQRQLAKWVGLDQSAVSRIEAGRRRVAAEELQRFADAFHVTADDLLPGALAGTQALMVSAEEMPLLSQPLPAAPGAALRAPATTQAPAGAVMDAVLEATAAGVVSEPSAAAVSPEASAANYAREAWHTRQAMRAPESGLPIRGVRRSARRAAPVGEQATSRTQPDRLEQQLADVARDWFELRRLAGDQEPILAWSTGHSAEGRPERFAYPVQPVERGSLGGRVLFDRVARFWRTELHVEPGDGPVPDLVPLLEDGLGIQVVVARPARYTAGSNASAAADGSAGRVSSERPVSAAIVVDTIPFIVVNAARPVILQRYALAHAFGHVVLGHGDVVDERIEWNRNNPREAAANDFAEEFLAPVRAVERWYERRGDPRPELETLLELGNAFGISAWSALFRSRAAGRLNSQRFARVRQQMHASEWELLPRQAFLGGLRDTLSHLTPADCLPPGRYGTPAVLRVPQAMRAWALAAIERGRLSVEDAAAYMRIDAGELATQLARLGLD